VSDDPSTVLQAAQELPLAGIRVVDMSTSYAGPTATMYLADLGADVIKVERPGGDDARSWGPPFVGADSAWFASANRNKRSIAIDLRTAEGLDMLDTLIAQSHVFVENVNPAKLTKMGIDPITLRARYPKLVYCALSGFGLTGPDSELPGYDLVAQARSGLMSVTGAKGGMPQRVSTAFSDIVSGLSAALAIIAALRKVERGGTGDLVDISLLDTDLALMAPRIASYLAGEPEPMPSGGTDSVLAVYQPFETADRPIVVAVGSDALWLRLCDTLGLPELAAEEALRTNPGRRAHRTRIIGLISEKLLAQPAEYWLAQFARASVPAARIQTLSDVVQDPQILARESIFELPMADNFANRQAAGDGITVNRVVAAPWRLSDSPAPRRPAPSLGQDTAEILRDAGYSSEQIAEFAQMGALGPMSLGEDALR
jgi:crotonobetainyl-CoA:carnitine CoA-transferase CaiB-like acyl-CoA transferase